jgi:Smg protein
MFEVLAFVYDNYLDPDACPELPALQRSLNTFGFDPGEVQAALLWLEDLKSAAGHLPACPTPQAIPAAGAAALRVLSGGELARLGQTGWGFLAFLVSIGSLPTLELELVLERALAAPGNPMGLDDLKLIVLMVFWGLGREPDALVLDELCDHQAPRLAH